MVKVKTVIPVNAKPGISIIQVKNPRTGMPTRVRVPPESTPGQIIELDLDNGNFKLGQSGLNNSSSVYPSFSGGIENTHHSRSMHVTPNQNPVIFPEMSNKHITPGSAAPTSVMPPVARSPPPTSAPMPNEFSKPRSYYIGEFKESKPLISSHPEEERDDDIGCYYRCIQFMKCSCL
jgi:hypothetical protein